MVCVLFSEGERECNDLKDLLSDGPRFVLRVGAGEEEKKTIKTRTEIGWKSPADKVRYFA